MATPLAVDDSGFMSEDAGTLVFDVRANDTLDSDAGALNALCFPLSGFEGAWLWLQYLFPDSASVFDEGLIFASGSAEAEFGGVFSLDVTDNQLIFDFHVSALWLMSDHNGPLLSDPFHYLTDFTGFMILDEGNGALLPGQVTVNADSIDINWAGNVIQEGSQAVLEVTFAPIVTIQAPAGVLLQASDVTPMITADNRIALTLGAAFNALGAGQTAEIRLSYVLEGDLLSDRDEAVLTVTVQGQNDVPVAVDDSGVASHVVDLLVDVLANDRDADATDTLVITAASLVEGLGEVVINSDQTLGYRTTGAYQGLAAGETATVTINYTIADGHGGSAGATLSLTVADINDAPDLALPAEMTLTDTAAADVFAPLAGQLMAVDPDAGDLLDYGLAGSGVVDHGDGTVSLSGAFGTLTVNRSSGAYVFVADAAAVNASAADGFEDFNVTVTDGSLTTVRTLRVNVDVLGTKVAGSTGTDYLSVDLDTLPPSDAPVTRVDLGEGLDVVLVNTAANHIGVSLLQAGVGNGTSLGGADGGLALKVQAEDSLNQAQGLEVRLDDEGVVLMSLSQPFLVRDQLSSQVLGSFGALVLGSQDGDYLVADPGFSFSSYMSGGQGDDVLGGSSENDILMGGEGVDTADFSQAANAVTASLRNRTSTGNGSDKLYSLENLTGSAAGDVLRGDSGANVLDGGAGADLLYGEGGHDVYVVDNAGDVVTELSGQGTDTVQSWINYTLGAHLENLTLLGSDNLNGAGNGLANVLTGNSGVNTLTGGGGNDSYYVDNILDAVVENAGQGSDRVFSSVSGYILGANVENLTLTGSGNLSGTGNAWANLLQGNSGDNMLEGAGGNDTLDGGTGADTLIGGQGNDIYYRDNSGDLVVELSGQGTDVLYSNVDCTLGENIEQLFLTGSADIDGMGNAAANQITGNAADNRLEGGGGNDSLVGAAGNDLYVLARGGGADTVLDVSGGDDILVFMGTISHDQLWFSRVGLNLEVKVLGTSDKLTVSNWYGGENYRVERIQSGNGMELLSSEVESLVQAMAMTSAPLSGQNSLNAAQHAALDAVIAANWS